MPNKLELAALKKKQKSDDLRQAEADKFAKKVANEVLGGVQNLNADERRVVEGMVTGLAKSVAEVIVASNEQIDQNLSDSFAKLLAATESNKPETIDHTVLLKNIGKQLASLELSPTINLEAVTYNELKTEVDRLLAKLPDSSKREVTIAYEQATADKYINVRLTDGIKFYSALGGGSGGGGSAVEGFALGQYDTIEATYPTAASELYTYKSGGSAIGTILVTYTDSTKAVLTSVVRS